MSETTTRLPGKYLLSGSWQDIEVHVDRYEYPSGKVMYVPLTPCCDATGKGSIGATVCRLCYAEVDDAFGGCWDEKEWAEFGPKEVTS